MGDAIISWDFPGKSFDPYVKYVCFLPKTKAHANMLIPKNSVGKKKKQKTNFVPHPIFGRGDNAKDYLCLPN